MEFIINYFILFDNILVMNISSIILLIELEIEFLGKCIYEVICDDEGYILLVLLVWFDVLFLRFLFECIFKEEYEKIKGDVL